MRENRVLIPKNKFDKQSYQEHLDHRLQVMLCLIYLTVCLLALGQMLKSMHECAERLCILYMRARLKLRFSVHRNDEHATERVERFWLWL